MQKQQRKTTLIRRKSDVNNAKADVTNKQAEADKTQSALNAAQTERDNAHDKVADLSDKLNSINTITLPNGYGSVEKYSDLSQYTDKGYALNKFKHSEADKKVTVNPTNLTAEQQKELTLWIAGILNDVRKQAGVNNRNVVNENSLKYAKVIADNYWDKWDHDKTALELGENAIGGTSFSQESISRGYVPVKETTIDAVKTRNL